MVVKLSFPCYFIVEKQSLGHLAKLVFARKILIPGFDAVVQHAGAISLPLKNLAMEGSIKPQLVKGRSEPMYLDPEALEILK